MSKIPRLFLRVLPLLLCMLMLSGCVYLHLLELKSQLGDFDKYFTLDQREGLVLGFKKPMLRDEDFRDFFKWVPSKIEKSGVAEKWIFGWEKERVAEDGNKEPVRYWFNAYFVNHKLVKIEAPEAFFVASVPKSLAVSALRSLGGARVDKAKRAASSTISEQDLEAAANERFLCEQGLVSVLGSPVSRGGTETAPEWSYRFHPVSAEQRMGNSEISMNFVLNPETHRVVIMRGISPFGSINFEMTGGRDGGSVKMTM